MGKKQIIAKDLVVALVSGQLGKRDHVFFVFISDQPYPETVDDIKTNVSPLRLFPLFPFFPLELQLLRSNKLLALT